MVHDELKPVYELWTLSEKFKAGFPNWLEGRFEGLNAETID